MIELFNHEYLKFKKYFGIALISLTGLLLILIFWGLFLIPKVKATSPKANATNGNLKKIEIKFNKPVNRSKISATISPDVTGTWQYEDQILNTHLFTKLVFYPIEYLTPEQSYSVKINNISSILNRVTNNFSFDFKAQPLPKIVSSSITDGQKDVPIDKPITFKLDLPTDGVVDYDFVFTPAVDATKSFSAKDLEYSLNLKTNLQQATQYSVTATRLLNGVEVKDDFTLNFTTQGPPLVSSYYPTGNNVFVDTAELGVVFDQELNSSELTSNISIIPALSGSWSWDQTNKKIIFKPKENMKYSTKYTIHINKGVHGTGSNSIPEDINLAFNTIGNIVVTGTTPKNGASGVTSTNIQINFDQDVDHASAESLFYLSPASQGTFSWSGNTMTFSASSFANDTSYSFGAKSGVKSIHGLPSTKSFDYSFSTKASETTLNIPQDYQDKPLSCEAAALKMALNYRGAGVSETDIMNVVGFDPTIRNGNVWGDPYTAFVGDINGKQDTTGYGVYWDPIARAANTWRVATAFTGWTATQIAEQISAGNPVVIWGVTGGSIARDDWVTPAGKNVLAWHGEHARTVIGFKGTSSNPISFTINDPHSGRITWTTSQLESNWSSLGNAGVVVY